MQKKILIVEDEPDIREALAYNLRAEGFESVEAESGHDALSALQDTDIDLVLLDLMLPDLSGLEVCRQIRQDSSLKNLPVIMVTAKGTEVDRVVGFELGADDYVVKPFSVREVVLRVKAVLSRTSGSEEKPDEKFRTGELTIDTKRHKVTFGGRPCDLTATEFRLLHHLAAHPGRAFDRDTLLDSVWGNDAFVTPRTVDTHIRRLREKLGMGGYMIETLRGVGYRFKEDDPS